jgi:hypothetical protein
MSLQGETLGRHRTNFQLFLYVENRFYKQPSDTSIL